MAPKTDADVLSQINDYIAQLRGNSQISAQSSAEVRQCIINDLTDTARFLKGLGADEIIWKRFYHTALALDDLKHGVVSPPLRAADVCNRKSDNSAIWAVRAKVAVAIECFLQSGMSRKKIATILSRQRSLEPLLRRGTDLKTAPFNWRDTLRRNKNKNETARSLWNEFEQACGEKRFDTSQECVAAANRFLHHANEASERLRSVDAI
jgi:hypothetical protein